MRARRRLQHRQHQPGEQRGTHSGHIRAHRAVRRQLRSDLSQCVPATTSARRVTVHRLPARLTCTLLALPPTAVHCSRGGYCWRCHLSLPRFTRSSSMCRERTAAGPDAPSRAEVGCFQKICDKGAVGTHETPTAPLSQIFWKHPTSHETPTAPLRREREREREGFLALTRTYLCRERQTTYTGDHEWTLISLCPCVTRARCR